MIEQLVLQLRKEVADFSNKTIAAERDLVAIQHRLEDLKERVKKLETESDVKMESIRRQLLELEKQVASQTKQVINIDATTRIDGNVDGDVAGGNIQK